MQSIDCELLVLVYIYVVHITDALWHWNFGYGYGYRCDVGDCSNVDGMFISDFYHQKANGQ